MLNILLMIAILVRVLKKENCHENHHHFGEPEKKGKHC